MWSQSSSLAAMACVFFFCLILGIYITGYSDSTFYASPLSVWQEQKASNRCDDTLTTEREPSLQLPSCSSSAESSVETKLLILTYMRSGSTFTGDLFDQHPEVFYVFEPLRAIQAATEHPKQTIWFWNRPSIRGDTASKEGVGALQDHTARGYFNCSFQDIILRGLHDPFMALSKKTNLFLRCLHADKGILGTLRCLSGLERSCCEAKVVALKTIRYTMPRALTLMADDPKVKVIHLVRDPRGTLLSQKKYDKFNDRTLGQFSTDFCHGVEEDLRASREAMNKFPQRILRIRYEDFATRPARFAEMLLKFAGLQMTEKQREHLQQITNSDSEKGNCRTCIHVLKTNSSHKAFAWRDKIKPSEVAKIDQNCVSVYKLAGYLPFDGLTELTNRSVPSMLEARDVPGFLN